MRKDYFEQLVTPKDLSQRSLQAGAVSVLAQATNMILQVISTVLLARLLLPDDFGLVAMVAAVTGFGALVVDLGTRDAVSQRDRITEGEMSALYWITFAVGLACALLTIVCAPLIARLYDEPRLELIAVVLSLNFLLPGLYFQQYALMRRALMFRSLALIDIASNALAIGIAVVVAYEGLGYWALIAKQVLSPLFATCGVWIACQWWPGRPSFTSGVKELLKFGLNVLAYSAADYGSRSADRVALGYSTGPRELGFYQNAYVAYDNPLSLFGAPLHNVAVASLSKLRADPSALKQAWSTALSSLAYFAAPLFVLLAVTGQDLIVLLLGAKWMVAGTILSVLALRGPAHVIERTAGWLHVAAGRADRWRRWGFFSCLMLLLALACGLPFGPLGVATAYTILGYVLFVPAVAYAGQPVGIRAADVVRIVGPQVLVSLGIAGVGLVLRQTAFVEMPPLARMVALIAVCGAAYVVVMSFGFRMNRPLMVAASLFAIVTKQADARVGPLQSCAPDEANGTHGQMGDARSVSPPLVSVVINNFNYAQFLPQSIESALAQTWPRVEVIVVDDASTDNSKSVMRRYSDCITPVFCEKNGGQGAALTAGIEASHGSIIMLLDADDYLYPDAADRVVACWSTEIAQIQYRLDLVDTFGRKIDLYPPPEVRLDSGNVVPLLLRSGRFETSVTSGLAFAKDALKKILPIPADDFRICADGYLVTVAPFRGGVVSIEAPLGAYRQHATSSWAASPRCEPAILAGHCRRSLYHDECKLRALKCVALAAGYSPSPHPEFCDHQHLAIRLASALLSPDEHIYPHDRRSTLAFRGAWSSRNANLSWRRRAVLAGWFVAVGFLPKAIAERVVMWRYSQASRPLGVDKLLKVVRRLGG